VIGGYSGNQLEFNVGIVKSGYELRSASKRKRITMSEIYHAHVSSRESDQQARDVAARHAGRRSTPPNVESLWSANATAGKQLTLRSAFVHDRIGRSDQLLPANGDEARQVRPGTDKKDYPLRCHLRLRNHKLVAYPP
jgi:hypothetical protein